MHTIRTTLGFIIDSRPYGETGKIMSIFTKDLGLIAATAQGIRLEKSKLRYHAQNYSFGDFSLVRGREFWRLTMASASDADNDTIKIEGEDYLNGKHIPTISSHALSTSKNLIVRLASLLKRLLQGEEAHPELFDCIQQAAQFLDQNHLLAENEFQTLESLVVARILHRLGYVGEMAEMNDALISTDISRQLLKDLNLKRIFMNRHINKALKESHL